MDTLVAFAAKVQKTCHFAEEMCIFAAKVQKVPIWKVLLNALRPYQNDLRSYEMLRSY